MKVFTINGYSGSGKTTAAEKVIEELVRRGYSVGAVKQIHHEDFSIDTEGTNTDRHRKAGASLVTARAVHETDVMYQQMLPIRKILSFYDQDYCVLEGVNDINAPKIITAHNTGEIDAKLDYRTFAISGVIAEELDEYKGYPVINCLKDTVRLADLIESKVPELMPDFDAHCCTACGYDCRTMLERILSGKSSSDDCVIYHGDIKLYMEGKPVNMVPFVQKILHNAVKGVISELDGYREGADIKIEIGKKL